MMPEEKVYEEIWRRKSIDDKSEENMKILLIFRVFNKHGGISRYVVELAERFIKEHETHLLTTDYDSEIPDLIVHKKPMIRKPFWLQILSNCYYNTKYAKKIKKEFDIDVINSDGAECISVDILRMQSVHKKAVDFYKRMGLKQRLYPLTPLNRVVLSIEKRVVERGNKKIIAISNNVKNDLLKYYNVSKEQITVIHSGVNINEFRPEKRIGKELRESIGIEDNEILLMFCGWEFKRKGLGEIIKAMPIINEELKLLVVGEDNKIPYLKLAKNLGIEQKLIFVGSIEKNLNKYYNAADIFVFPTLYEPFGLVITEAMASGSPVITSKFAGAAEIIKDGYDGLLINDPTNHNEIAEKLNSLIKDENHRKSISKNARKTAEKYSWDNVAKKTLEVYEEVIRR